MTSHAWCRSACILRNAGPPGPVAGVGMQVDDARLATLIDPAAPLLLLFEHAVHGEGPVWEASRERLIFSDVTGRRVNAWYPDGRVEVVIDATPYINGNAIDADGGLVHCEHLRRCISRSLANDGMPEPIVTHFEGKRLNTPNDIAVTADGAIWFTDPIFGLINPQQGCLGEPELDHRSVYRIDPTVGALQRMADFDQPNGLAFSHDDRTLYVSDTSRAIGGSTHEIIAFDVGTDGTLTSRRFFCHTDHGEPDGFLVDARGWIWTTAADGIHVFDDPGRKIGYLPTPDTATNVTFGGTDGRRLFITTEQYLLALDLATPDAT